jgi:DNA-binding SARP family transcriptional activator
VPLFDATPPFTAPDGPSLTLLGTLDLAGVADAEAILTQPRRVALLALLALEGARGFVRRDRLAATFWPEQDTSSARAALRKAVHGLRRVLGDEAIIARGDEELRLDPARLWCDVLAFDAAHAAGAHARALELHGGPLLDGFHADLAEFDRWLEVERAERREAAASSAWALASQLEQAQDLTRAAQWARKAARLAGTDERRVRAAMALLDRAGSRADAVRIYDEFAAFLKHEYDVAPATETQALAARLRD